MTSSYFGVTRPQHIQPQPPRFGVVEDAEGIDVLWEDGRFTQTIPDGNLLDVIHDCTVTNEGLLGKVVRFRMYSNLQGSAAYDAVVVNVYRRERGGGDEISEDYVLVQLLSNGMWYELLASSDVYTDVSRLDDR